MSKQLKDRIAELERRVRDLEARPVFVPQYVPIPVQPYAPPTYPYPHPWAIPVMSWGSATCVPIPGAVTT